MRGPPRFDESTRPTTILTSTSTVNSEISTVRETASHPAVRGFLSVHLDGSGALNANQPGLLGLAQKILRLSPCGAQRDREFLVASDHAQIHGTALARPDLTRQLIPGTDGTVVATMTTRSPAWSPAPAAGEPGCTPLISEVRYGTPKNVNTKRNTTMANRKFAPGPAATMAKRLGQTPVREGPVPVFGAHLFTGILPHHLDVPSQGEGTHAVFRFAVSADQYFRTEARGRRSRRPRRPSWPRESGPARGETPARRTPRRRRQPCRRCRSRWQSVLPHELLGERPGPLIGLEDLLQGSRLDGLVRRDGFLTDLMDLPKTEASVQEGGPPPPRWRRLRTGGTVPPRARAP